MAQVNEAQIGSHPLHVAERSAFRAEEIQQVDDREGLIVSAASTISSPSSGEGSRPADSLLDRLRR